MSDPVLYAIGNEIQRLNKSIARAETIAAGKQYERSLMARGRKQVLLGCLDSVRLIQELYVENRPQAKEYP